MLSRSLAAHADRLPRSGYRGSDFVHWHSSTFRCAPPTVRSWGSHCRRRIVTSASSLTRTGQSQFQGRQGKGSQL